MVYRALPLHNQGVSPLRLLSYTIFDQLLQQLEDWTVRTPYWVMGLLVVGLFVIFIWSMMRKFFLISGAILLVTAIMLTIWMVTGSHT